MISNGSWPEVPDQFICSLGDIATSTREELPNRLPADDLLTTLEIAIMNVGEQQVFQYFPL